jgi:hypothetical protein
LLTFGHGVLSPSTAYNFCTAKIRPLGDPHMAARIGRSRRNSAMPQS